MLKVNSITLKNFLSHTSTSLNFDDHKGLVLIEGVNSDGKYESNGAGKSSILEGIVYALSGSTLRGVGVNDVINRNVGKDTCVTLDVSVEDKDYTIKRYRKDTAKGDKLELLRGEENLSKRLNKDTQTIVDNIVSIPYEVLINTMLLGEGLSSRFTQLSDSDKKSLIESTLSLQYDLNKSRDSVNEKLKSMKLERSKLSGSIETLQKLIEDRDIAEVNLENLQVSLRLRSNELQKVDSSIPDLASKVEISRKRLTILGHSLEELEYAEKSIKSLDEDIAHYVSQITEILESKDTCRCSHCGQLLSTDESRETVLGQFRGLVDEKTVEMSAHRDKVASLPPKQILEEKFELESSQNSQYELDLSKAQYSLQDLKVRVAELKTGVAGYTEMLENFDERLSLLCQQENDVRDIDSSISDYEYLYKLYSPTGIMVYILEDAISYINTRIRKYTEVLLDKKYELALEKGKIVLKDELGASYQSLSNGEKRRLDVSIQFSLHDYTHIYCGNSCNILFLDEVLDTLDSVGVNNILEVLNMKRDYCKLDCIYVITHNNSLKSYFDSVITVYKDAEGNSRIQ